MDFDNFCSFFECYSILAEKQQTKQTSYSSLSLFASLDIQDSGITVEWKKFRQENQVWPTTLLLAPYGFSYLPTALPPFSLSTWPKEMVHIYKSLLVVALQHFLLSI